MKNNFLFRNYGSIKEYLRVVLIAQITGTILFAGSAFVLLKSGFRPEQTVFISSMCVIVYILGFVYLSYKNQFLFLSADLWPADSDEDILIFLRKLVKKVTSQNQSLSNMQYRTEIMLTDNVEMRRKAQAVRMPSTFLKELSTNYLEILAIRSSVKESKYTADGLFADYSQALKLAEEGHDTTEVVDLMDSLAKVRAEDSKLKKLKMKEKEISRIQNVALRTLSG